MIQTPTQLRPHSTYIFILSLDIFRENMNNYFSKVDDPCTIFVSTKEDIYMIDATLSKDILTSLKEVYA